MLKDDPAKIRALVAAAKDLHEKQADILAELDCLLGGGVGIAMQVKAVEAAYSEVWQTRYHTAYIWKYPVDRPHTKRLIKMLGVEEVSTRAARYISSDDSFIATRRHPFGLFVHGINSYAGPATEHFALTIASGCEHEPACRSDVLHTSRIQRELRA